MKLFPVILCVASTLVVAGCGGESKGQTGTCASPRPSDAAIVKAVSLDRNQHSDRKANIELRAVLDCDSNGTREVWYQTSYANDDRTWPGKTALRHADNGKWYLIDGHLIEVSKD